MQVFAEVGIPADREHVARLIGADGKRLAKEVANVAGGHIDDDRAEAVDKRSGEIFDEMNTSPRPIAGARPLLLALGRSALPWAIATSSLPQQVRASVAALELSDEPRIVDGSHVEHAKPAPDLLLLAAEQLKVAPRELLVRRRLDLGHARLGRGGNDRHRGSLRRGVEVGTRQRRREGRHDVSGACSLTSSDEGWSASP